MDLNEKITKFIGEIQDNRCRGCNYGKALITLLDLQKSLEQTIQREPLKAKQENKSAPSDVHTKAERKREAQRRWREKQMAKEAAGVIHDPVPVKNPATKTCTACEKEKQLAEFHVNKTGKYGRDSQCAECKNEAIRKYKEKSDPAANPDKSHRCDGCGKRFMALGSLIAHKKDNCPERETA